MRHDHFLQNDTNVIGFLLYSKAGISVAKLGRQLQVRIYWRLPLFWLANLMRLKRELLAQQGVSVS